MNIFRLKGTVGLKPCLNKCSDEWALPDAFPRREQFIVQGIPRPLLPPLLEAFKQGLGLLWQFRRICLDKVRSFTFRFEAKEALSDGVQSELRTIIACLSILSHRPEGMVLEHVGHKLPKASWVKLFVAVPGFRVFM